MIKKFFSVVGFSLTLALFSFLLILGGEEKPARSPSSPLAPAGLITGYDLPQLAAHIGTSVPHLSAAGSGNVKDVPFADGYAHLLTWTDENNITVRCVRPAAAAPLLRGDGVQPTGESCVIDGMTALILTGEQCTELHFGDDLAAFCLSANVPASSLIEAAAQLQFTP